MDGLRIDVAHGLHKRDGLPDHEFAIDDELTGDPVNPYAWNQPEVHEVWRSWRALAEEYTERTGRERVLVGEVGVLDTAELASYQRPDELHQSFFFEFLRAPWDAESLSQVIDRGLGTVAAHDSPVAWVLNNHDMPRSVTRYAGGAPGVSAGDVDLGITRARAAALLMLALPGSVYLYQGEELGLPEVVDLPDAVLTDPMFRRTGGARRGRDGCRVPLPWTSTGDAFGFSPTDSPHPALAAAARMVRVLLGRPPARVRRVHAPPVPRGARPATPRAGTFHGPVPLVADGAGRARLHARRQPRMRRQLLPSARVRPARVPAPAGQRSGGGRQGAAGQRRMVPPGGQVMSSEDPPLLLGYIRADLLRNGTELPQVKAQLEAFADREKFSLGGVLVAEGDTAGDVQRTDARWPTTKPHGASSSRIFAT